MHSHASAWSRSFSLVLCRQATFAFCQVAIHQAIAILREVGIVEAQGVAHLVHDSSQQVDAPCRRAGRIGVATSSRNSLTKLRVVLGWRTNEPTIPTRVSAHADA